MADWSDWAYARLVTVAPDTASMSALYASTAAAFKTGTA